MPPLDPPAGDAPASDGGARSVQAPLPGRGRADAGTSTTVEYLDLSAFVGQYVRAIFDGADHYFLAVESATPATAPDPAATTGDGVMDLAKDGVPEHFVVSPRCPFLAYRTVSGTGTLRVFRR